MARKIIERLALEGTLVLTSPMSLGGGEDAWICDITVARNGAGQVVIPGTSIAGALRSWFEAEGSGSDDAFRAVWGFVGAESAGAASHLVFHDAVLESGGLQIRDHVGIDRVEGRAAENIKFDRQSVTRGARFRFKLTADIPAGDTAASVRDAVLHIRDTLVDGVIRLGGATTRGYGAVKLDGPVLKIVSLQSRDSFLKALSGEVANAGSLVPSTSLKRPGSLTLRVRWSPTGPIMVKASEEGFEIKIVPLTTEVDGKQIPFIPGSSIKGVMRAMAERIIATVCALDPPNTLGGTRFRQMMGEDINASSPLVTALFGTAREEAEAGEKQARRGKAALTFYDVRAENIEVPSHAWRRMIDVGQIDEDLGATARQTMNVAIDRFTATPADGKLFSSLTLLGLQYTDIKIELSLLRLSQLGPGDRAAALALLLLVLREMADGQVPIGSGSTRGLGAVAIDDLTFSLSGEAVDDAVGEMAGIGWADFSAFVAGEDTSPKMGAIIAGWKQFIEQQRSAA